MTTAPDSQDLATWLAVPAIADSESGDAVIAAARSVIEARCTIPVDPDAYPDTVRLAVLIQAARWYKRSLSPEGVISFDGGAIRTFTVIDGDVEALIMHDLALTGFSGGSDE